MEIFLPVSIVLLLTFFTLLRMSYLRIRAIKNRDVHYQYFIAYKSVNGEELPDKLQIISRHYQNLLELPVIFYVLCLFGLFVLPELGIFYYFAWAFSFSRVIHSCIHLTYNNPTHRMLSFGVGLLMIIGMCTILIGKTFPSMLGN